MQLLNHFLHSPNQPHPLSGNTNALTFERFRQAWKDGNMQYIFLIKHRLETLEHFLNECIQFLVTCIYFEFSKTSSEEPNYDICICSVYILYTLVTQQPTFEDNSEPVFIYLPEYCFDAFVKLSHRLEGLRDINKDPATILKWMFRNNFFIFGVERPISYSTSKADPYPKEYDFVFYLNLSFYLPFINIES